MCFAICVLISAVWVRRHTFGSVWERDATVHLATHAVALMLVSHALSPAIGDVLHAITGCWHVDVIAGAVAYLCAALALERGIQMRFEPTGHERRLRRLTALTVVMIAVGFVASHTAHTRDDHAVELDVWMRLCLTVFSASMLVILTACIHPLLILRREPGSRTTASAYLAAISAGIAACVLCLAGAGVSVIPVESSAISLLAISAAVTIAIGAGRSWVAKVRELQCEPRCVCRAKVRGKVRPWRMRGTHPPGPTQSA